MIRIKDFKISVLNDNEDFIKKKISKTLNISLEDINSYSIDKKSIDARDKNNILYVYTLDVVINNEDKVLCMVKHNNIYKTPKEEYIYPEKGDLIDNERPVIIGSGPSGLFCSYILSELGYKPLIIEKGEKIEERVKTVEEFWKTGKLNTNSNVSFGEGGAGTFSDGKLNTMIKDKYFRIKKVFEIFVSCGAPKEIMYISNPHIGTDVLRKVIINMRNKIISNGGEFMFNKTMTDIIIKDNKVIGIRLNDDTTVNCNNLFLCIGHSARDTFYMLNKNNISMENKPFAVGFRIVHDQDLINEAMYGNFSSILGPANYKLTYNTKDKRGVYSFCMCPGGYVVNSSSEEGRLVINGMSNYKRDSEYANSALIVTVNEDDYGKELFDGVKFQEKLEESTYNSCNGLIPSQTYKDFKNNTLGKVPKKDITKGEYKEYNLNDLVPGYISSSIKEAMIDFGRKIRGFDDDESILLGIESRTSSPIKILRNEEGISNIEGIYPTGEGAGYAGGITSSAVDGIKQAENYIKRYKTNL